LRAALGCSVGGNAVRSTERGLPAEPALRATALMQVNHGRVPVGKGVR
jgi:hypothetical protein